MAVSGACLGVVRVLDLLSVAPEILRVVPVGSDLIEIAEEVVEALAIGCTRRCVIAQPPLADQRRRIALRLQYLGEGHVLGAKRRPPVSADTRVTGVLPRHQHAPRRCADGATRVVAVEAHPLGRHSIDAGRLDQPASEGPEVGETGVVGEDVDDVGGQGIGRGDGRGHADLQRPDEDYAQRSHPGGFAQEGDHAIHAPSPIGGSISVPGAPRRPRCSR